MLGTMLSKGFPRIITLHSYINPLRQVIIIYPLNTLSAFYMLSIFKALGVQL